MSSSPSCGACVGFPHFIHHHHFIYILSITKCYKIFSVFLLPWVPLPVLIAFLFLSDPKKFGRYKTPAGEDGGCADGEQVVTHAVVRLG